MSYSRERIDIYPSMMGKIRLYSNFRRHFKTFHEKPKIAGGQQGPFTNCQDTFSDDFLYLTYEGQKNKQRSFLCAV